MSNMDVPQTPSVHPSLPPTTSAEVLSPRSFFEVAELVEYVGSFLTPRPDRVRASRTSKLWFAVLTVDDRSSLYDRQIRLWGLEAQHRIQESKVLIVGLNRVGVEVAKSLILCGVEQLFLYDSKPFSPDDYQTLLAAGMISTQHNRQQLNQRLFGKERAQVFQSYLNGLNSRYATVTALSSSSSSAREDKDDDGNSFSSRCWADHEFDVICFLIHHDDESTEEKNSKFVSSNNCQAHNKERDADVTLPRKDTTIAAHSCSLSSTIRWNDFARARGARFIYGRVTGMAGSIFVDAGDRYKIYNTDENFEPLYNSKIYGGCPVEEINEEEGLVTISSSAERPICAQLTPGDQVFFTQLSGGAALMNSSMILVDGEDKDQIDGEHDNNNSRCSSSSIFKFVRGADGQEEKVAFEVEEILNTHCFKISKMGCRPKGGNGGGIVPVVAAAPRGDGYVYRLPRSAVIHHQPLSNRMMDELVDSSGRTPTALPPAPPFPSSPPLEAGTEEPSLLTPIATSFFGGIIAQEALKLCGQVFLPLASCCSSGDDRSGDGDDEGSSQWFHYNLQGGGCQGSRGQHATPATSVSEDRLRPRVVLAGLGSIGNEVLKILQSINHLLTTTSSDNSNDVCSSSNYDDDPMRRRRRSSASCLFQDIVVIDDGKVRIPHLSSQPLFSRRDIRKSKAQCVADTFRQSLLPPTDSGSSSGLKPVVSSVDDDDDVATMSSVGSSSIIQARGYSISSSVLQSAVSDGSEKREVLSDLDELLSSSSSSPSALPIVIGALGGNSQKLLNDACVVNSCAFFDVGVEGTKCHVQPIIPNLTLSLSQNTVGGGHDANSYLHSGAGWFGRMNFGNSSLTAFERMQARRRHMNSAEGIVEWAIDRFSSLLERNYGAITKLLGDTDTGEGQRKNDPDEETEQDVDRQWLETFAYWHQDEKTSFNKLFFGSVVSSSSSSLVNSCSPLALRPFSALDCVHWACYHLVSENFSVVTNTATGSSEVLPDAISKKLLLESVDPEIDREQFHFISAGAKLRSKMFGIIFDFSEKQILAAAKDFFSEQLLPSRRKTDSTSSFDVPLFLEKKMGNVELPRDFEDGSVSQFAAVFKDEGRRIPTPFSASSLFDPDLVETFIVSLARIRSRALNAPKPDNSLLRTLFHRERKIPKILPTSTIAASLTVIEVIKYIKMMEVENCGEEQLHGKGTCQRGVRGSNDDESPSLVQLPESPSGELHHHHRRPLFNPRAGRFDRWLRQSYFKTSFVNTSPAHRMLNGGGPQRAAGSHDLLIQCSPLGGVDKILLDSPVIAPAKESSETTGRVVEEAESTTVAIVDRKYSYTIWDTVTVDCCSRSSSQQNSKEEKEDIPLHELRSILREEHGWEIELLSTEALMLWAPWVKSHKNNDLLPVGELYESKSKRNREGGSGSVIGSLHGSSTDRTTGKSRPCQTLYLLACDQYEEDLPVVKYIYRPAGPGRD